MFFKKKKKIQQLENQKEQLEKKLLEAIGDKRHLEKIIADMQRRNDSMDEKLYQLSKMKMVKPYHESGCEVIGETKTHVLSFVMECNPAHHLSGNFPPEKKLRIKEK